MTEKEIVEALKTAAAGLGGVDVYDWPFEEDAEKYFYVEVGEGESWQRFTIHVEEIARFQVGNTYF
jgi:hypothetical protein